MPEKKTSTKAAPKATKAATKAENLSGTKVGVVESDKRTKTRRVVVNYLSQHPKYGKFIRQRTVLQVHDENNESHSGDIVEVTPCRPISKTKSWKLVRIVERRAELAAAIASVKEVQ
jgi:small subunit ribosomal protein S17